MTGENESVDINEESELVFYLAKLEFWDFKITKSEDSLDSFIFNLREFGLKISQAFEFYNIIGEEDKNEFNI